MPKKNGNVNLKVYRNNIELEKKTCTETKHYSAGLKARSDSGQKQDQI